MSSKTSPPSSTADNTLPPVPEGYERRVIDLWANDDDDNNDDVKSSTVPVDVQYVLVRLPEYENYTTVGFENDNYRIFQQNLLEFRRIRDPKPVMVVYQPPTKATSSTSTPSSAATTTTTTSSSSVERGAPYALYRGRWHTKSTPFTNQTNLVVAQTFEGNNASTTTKTTDINKNTKAPDAAGGGGVKVGSKRGRDGEEEDHRTLTAGYPISAIMTLDRIPL